MQKITPFLWFDTQAEEAANFYVSIFRDSKILSFLRHGNAAAKANGMPEGSVLMVEFQIEGQKFAALNGNKTFPNSPATSFLVNCETQEEIDKYWDKLTEGGEVEAQQCGWLKDKFGVSWQVAPRILLEMIQDEDKEKAERVMQAMMQMKKIEIEPLKRAYEGKLTKVPA